jgi:hypothetical protein
MVSDQLHDSSAFARQKSRGYVGPRTGMDAEEKEKFVASPRNQTQAVYRGKSLY